MTGTKAYNHLAKQPSAVANYTFGPVSGLISGANLNHHLPMLEHSGVLMILYLYTVAGAASDLVKTLPTSRLTRRFDTLLEPESRAQL